MEYKFSVYEATADVWEVNITDGGFIPTIQYTN